MDALRAAAALALLLPPIAVDTQPVPAQIARWQPYVIEAATRFGIPTDWIDRVMWVESRGKTTLGGAPIRSRAGAIGLMQLMPATWAAMRDASRLGANPDDPHDNIIAGAAYLRMMDDRFGYPGLFGAYNAGPERYAAYLAGRSRLPGETIAYLAGISGGRSSIAVTVANPSPELLFVLRRDLGETAPHADGSSSSEGIFAIRKSLR